MQDSPRRVESLRPHQRLKDPNDFKKVYAAQEALHGPSVVIFYRHNELDVSRMGVSVGRKHGNAVRRNRIKRVLREAFRLTQRQFPPGMDYVLIPRRSVQAYGTQDVIADLERLARKVPIPGEGTRAAVARTGDPRREEAKDRAQGARTRRGISSRTFLKRPPPKP